MGCSWHVRYAPSQYSLYTHLIGDSIVCLHLAQMCVSVVTDSFHSFCAPRKGVIYHSLAIFLLRGLAVAWRASGAAEF